MEEKAPVKSIKVITELKSEKKVGKNVVTSGKEKTKVIETEQKSLHERIKINKDIIAKRQGKDSTAKGVELI